MPVHVALETALTIGKKTTVQGPWKTPPRGVVFEDDGQAGYFYAVEHRASGERKMLDAVQIYEARSVPAAERDVRLKLVWSLDGNKAALMINDFTHAVFDFHLHRGYSRQHYGKTPGRWSTYDHRWDEQALDSLM
ncbi:MAG: DUF2251 domain-containing protein [Pirellulales bacterium]|nr:DUF2251 domain-containing protein [Pirellulales bacterium]